MDTLHDLEKYLEDACYSFSEITIGSHYAPEGYVIEKSNDSYNYCYSERGNKQIIKSFTNEKDLVDYAVCKLDSNKWNKAHLVAWLWTKEEIKEAELVLEKKNISFSRNDIPNFSEGKTAYRIFVFGRDILLLDAYKKKYLKG